jgi:hypothetical protein
MRIYESTDSFLKPLRSTPGGQASRPEMHSDHSKAFSVGFLRSESLPRRSRLELVRLTGAAQDIYSKGRIRTGPRDSDWPAGWTLGRRLRPCVAESTRELSAAERTGGPGP